MDLDTRLSQLDQPQEPAACALPSDKALKSPGAALCREAFTLFNEDPKGILHEWQTGMSLTEKRAGISDGQLRSRRENQVWRTWAMSQCHTPEVASVSRPLPSKPSRQLLSSSKPRPRTLVLEDHMPQPTHPPADQPMRIGSAGKGRSNPMMWGACVAAPVPVPMCPEMCLPAGYVCVAVPTSLLPQMQTWAVTQ